MGNRNHLECNKA